MGITHQPQLVIEGFLNPQYQKAIIISQPFQTSHHVFTPPATTVSDVKLHFGINKASLTQGKSTRSKECVACVGFSTPEDLGGPVKSRDGCIYTWGVS